MSPHHDDPDRIELELGSQLAPDLELIRLLGEGGMGRVYLAREPALARTVAIKVLDPGVATDPSAVARFRREAQSVASLSHPNVVAVHSVGDLPSGVPYFVMQFVQGRNLQERIQEEGVLGALEARRVLGEVAFALEAAHARGIVHRDVKAANVLLDDETGRALVADFGIAAVEAGHELAPDARLTTTGVFVGSPAYMSPEQLAGDPVSSESDIYSFGLLIYEVLAGRGPFVADSARAMMVSHLRDDPPPLSELVPDVEPELEALAVACLSKNADERPTAAQITARLGAANGALLEWPPPGLEFMRGKSQRLAVELGVGAAFLAVGGLLGVIAQGLESTASVAWVVWMCVSAAAVITAGSLIWRGVTLALGFLRGRRYGYGLLTALEVFCDIRGDTGALIGGTREYASLPPRRRRSLRIGRVLGALSQMLAAVSPVVAGLMTLRVASVASRGSQDSGIEGFGWVFASVLLLCMGPILFFEDREERAVRKYRKQFEGRRERRGDTVRLADGWERAYRSAAVGQGIPPGPKSRGPILAGIALFLAVCTSVLVGVVFPLGVAAPAATMVSLPLVHYEDALAQTRLIRVGRTLAHTPDSTLTALGAGRLAFEVGALGNSLNDLHPWIRRDHGHEPAPLQRRVDPPFERRWPGLLETLYTKAADGFSEGQLEYLTELAAHPGLASFARLARAPALDEWAHLLADSLPPLAGLPYWIMFDFDMPTGGLRDAGWAQHASAALAVREGDFTGAEERVRTTISVGVLLLEQSISHSTVDLGSRMIHDGLRALQEIAVLRGDPAQALEIGDATAAALSNRPEWARRLATSTPGTSWLGRDFWLGAQQLMVDPDSPRALRWEMLIYSRIVDRCGGVGPTLWNGPSGVGSLTPAENEFTSMESTRRMLDAVDRNLTVAGLPDARPPSLPARAALALARMSAWVLGSEGIAYCTELTLLPDLR